MPGHPSSVTRNTILNLAGQALPLVVGFVALPTIVDGLGTDRFGLLGLGWVVLGYFSFLDLGMARASARFAAEAIGRGARHEVADIVSSAIVVQLVVGLAGAVVLGVGAPFLT